MKKFAAIGAIGLTLIGGTVAMANIPVLTLQDEFEVAYAVTEDNLQHWQSKGVEIDVTNQVGTHQVILMAKYGSVTQIANLDGSITILEGVEGFSEWQSLEVGYNDDIIYNMSQFPELEKALSVVHEYGAFIDSNGVAYPNKK